MSSRKVLSLELRMCSNIFPGTSRSVIGLQLLGFVGFGYEFRGGFLPAARELTGEYGRVEYVCEVL